MTTRRAFLMGMAALSATRRLGAVRATEPVRLVTLLGDYPTTRPLKQGEIASTQVSLQFADVKVPNTAFKRTVRNLEFDVSELAIGTFLIAKAFAKPLVLLPVVVFSRDQYPYLVYNHDRGALAPKDLTGKRIGVRSYSTTTAMWIRGLLQQEYAVDLARVKWVTFEDPHVAEYHDPATVERAPAGSDLATLLLKGDVDAAIIDPVPADPRIVPVFPDAAAAARAWRVRHHAIQINHMVVVKESLTRSNPSAVREVFRLIAESKRAASLSPGPDADGTPCGLAAVRPSLEAAVDTAWRQGLIPRAFTVEDLCNDVTASLT